MRRFDPDPRLHIFNSLERPPEKSEKATVAETEAGRPPLLTESPLLPFPCFNDSSSLLPRDNGPLFSHGVRFGRIGVSLFNSGGKVHTMKVPYAKEWQKETQQAAQNRTRLRSDGGTQVGQALLHVPEEERGRRHPAQGVVRACVLQRRAAKRREAYPHEGRRAYTGGAPTPRRQPANLSRRAAN